MSRVLVTHPRDRFDLYFGDRALQGLRKVADVRVNPNSRVLTDAELVDAATDCDVIISYRGMPASEGLLQQLPQLKALVRCAMDIRNIDVDAASRLGILVTRTGAGFVAAVAEWVLGMMLAMSRDLAHYAQVYRSGASPLPRMGRELAGSVLGVLGYGRTGRAVAALGAAFGMRVLVFDPDSKPERGVAHVSFERLLCESDYVVCLAASTPDSQNLMGRRAFELMKPQACFINAARGDLVDESALFDALSSGRIAGCALDVGRDEDQMPPLKLARHPRVLATPHVGGLTRPATEFQALQAVDQVACILDGRLPEGAVNAEAASRSGLDAPALSSNP